MTVKERRGGWSRDDVVVPPMTCLPGAGDGNHHERAKLQKLSQRGAVRVARLTAMAFSDKAEERAVAAGHPSTPEDNLELLAFDDDYNVRSWVVRNTSTPDDLLFLMEDDEDSRIRAAATAELEWRNHD